MMHLPWFTANQREDPEFEQFLTTHHNTAAYLSRCVDRLGDDIKSLSRQVEADTKEEESSHE